MINFQVTAAGFYAGGGRILGCYVVQYSWSVPTFQSYHGLHLRKGQLQRFRRCGAEGGREVCRLCSNSCFSPGDRSMRRVFELSSDKNNIDCTVLRIIVRTV